MSSTSLDKRLKDVLHKSHLHKKLVGMDALYTEAGIIPHLSEEKAIVAIKQAFIDEGWMNVDDLATAHLMGTARAHGLLLLSGPEWLARFRDQISSSWSSLASI